MNYKLYSNALFWFRFWSDISSVIWHYPVLAGFQKNAIWCIPGI